MKIPSTLYLCLAMCTTSTPLPAQQLDAPKPIVIAHRGASGYLPEHTEGAKVLALAQGADYIEQDVVLSKDMVFVVSHDITMEETTDVEERFPSRSRGDGRYYFADFTWDEIQGLSIHERTSRRSGKAAFPGRFPDTFHQHPVRLEDEIKLIQGWNQVRKAQVGIYVELKSPSWHKKEFGVSMGEKLIPLLAASGYRTKTDLCFLQCFEEGELRDIRASGCSLRLVQLAGGEEPQGGDDRWEVWAQKVATYADGVGPTIDWLVDTKKGAGNPSGMVSASGLVSAARKSKLFIHPYTVRKDALPRWSKSLEELHHFLIRDQKVDGFFTDFPDRSRAACDLGLTN